MNYTNRIKQAYLLVQCNFPVTYPLPDKHQPILNSQLQTSHFRRQQSVEMLKKSSWVCNSSSLLGAFWGGRCSTDLSQWERPRGMCSCAEGMQCPAKCQWWEAGQQASELTYAMCICLVCVFWSCKYFTNVCGTWIESKGSVHLWSEREFAKQMGY